MDHVPIARASLATSLDGFIADPDGGVGWLDDFFAEELDFSAFMGRFGAIVVGRRTFDAARAKGYPIRLARHEVFANGIANLVYGRAN